MRWGDDDVLTLREAATHMKWDPRTLRAMLKKAGITPIGRGRAARLVGSDIKLLIERSRQQQAAEHKPPISHAIAASLRRREAQQRRASRSKGQSPTDTK